MKVFTAPEIAPIGWGKSAIFLAGSIENGKAREWQKEVIDALCGHNDMHSLVVLNPRRANWDPSWSESENDPRLVKQINWELDCIEVADLTFFYFQAGTNSPISLLELGKVTGLGHSAIVVCEPDFYRRTNVLVTAQRAGFEVFDTLQEGIDRLLQVEF